MSDQNDDKELEEMRQQILDAEASEGSAASAILGEPQPAPQVESVNAQAQNPTPAAPQPSENGTQAQPTPPNPDDPLRWAQDKKGLKTPEELARAYQQLEQEFHKRNQQGHPGYQDLNGNPAPVPPPPPQGWNPNPQAPAYGYGYPPPPPRPTRQDITRQLAEKHRMDPEDVERIAPLVFELAEAVANQRVSPLEREVVNVRASSARNAELFQLMQDPAFSDPRVEAEMREVLKEGSVFQRERQPYIKAFQLALENLARKQLQQSGTTASVGNQTMGSRPPVTAGGGNGSPVNGPRVLSPKDIERMPLEDMEKLLRQSGVKR